MQPQQQNSQSQYYKEIMNLNQIYGSDKPHKCGYCDKNGALSWSFTKQKMLPKTYQLLIERGWRRCGDYYYKNNLQKACCKQWTIRQDVTNFKMKKDQKKTIKKMMALAYQCQEVITELKKKKTPQKEQLNKIKKSKGKITLSVNEDIKQLMLNTCLRINKGITQLISKKIQLGEIIGNFNFDITDKLKFFTSDANSNGDYYCNYIMLLYGVNKKLFTDKNYTIFQFIKDMKPTVQNLGIGPDSKVQIERSGYLIFFLSQKHKKQKSSQFQIIQLNPDVMIDENGQKSPSKKQNKEKQHKIKFIQKVKDKFIKNKLKVPSNQKRQSQPEIVKPVYKGQITITTDQIRFGKIKIDIVPVQQSNQSWKLYQLYCQNIHDKKQKTMSSYINFLCSKGLISQTKKSQKNCQEMYIPSWDLNQLYQKGKIIGKGVTKKTGCFHMKYYLQNKLIGVGVVDIVPSGLSSVYFFYDPEYKERRLGVFSSLIEIQYVRYLSKVFHEFKYYYMGFYIQNTEKMNYKSDYGPCHLLCPQTYQFVQFTPQLKVLVQKIESGQIKSIRLAGKDVKRLNDLDFQGDIGVYINNHIKLAYKGQSLALSQIRKQFFVPILNLMRNYIQVFGKQVFEILTFSL